MKKIKLGIVGTGSFVQRRILPIVRNIESIQITCLHNRDIKKAKEIAAKFHIPDAVSSRDELIHHPKVDAVFIASPNHCHEEDAIACAKANKSVLCEKPLAPTVKAILKMQKSFAKSAAELFVGHSLRFKPSVQKAKQLLASGVLGKLLHFRAYFTLPVPENNWRYQKSYGGGVLQDIGVHLIDLIRFVTGDEMASAYAISDIESPIQSDVSVTALGKLRCEANFSIECSMNQPLRSGFEVIGTKARLISSGSLRQTYDLGETLCLISEDDSLIYLPLKAGNIYEAELRHFGDILQGKAKSILDAQEGLYNQIAIEALYASIGSKIPHQLDFSAKH